MSLWRRLLGLDRASAHGSLEVAVRYLDGSGDDGDAAGSGFLTVAPEGLLWQIVGFNHGNRDWPDVTTWTQVDHAGAESTLVVAFEGRLRVKRDLASVRITVQLASTTREVTKLTMQARQYVEPDRIQRATDSA